MKEPKLIVQPHGGALRKGGTPGNKGGGRPRDEWKQSLQCLASREATRAHLDAVLDEGPAHPFFWKALDYVTEHGFGRASQTVGLEHSGDLVIKGYVNLPSMPDE